MRRLFHNLTTLSLAATVLAGSLLSPGVRHVHSQGDVPHSHDVAVVSHDVNHGHAHDESHKHHGNHSHESVFASSGDLVDLIGHWHTSLLGIDFTFPQEGEPGEPFSLYEGTLVVLRLTPDVVVSVADGHSDLVDLSSSDGVSADRIDVASARFANAHALPVDRILLCDTARCERSGVLLT